MYAIFWRDERCSGPHRHRLDTSALSCREDGRDRPAGRLTFLLGLADKAARPLHAVSCAFPVAGNIAGSQNWGLFDMKAD